MTIEKDTVVTDAAETETPKKTSGTRSKNTRTRKKTTPAKSTESTTQNEKKEPVKPVVKKKSYAATDLIPCKSVTRGSLSFISPKTKNMYEWGDYGDYCDVEWQDLNYLRARRSNFLLAPYFLIDDEELVEQWSKDLKEIYDLFDDFNDPDDFFNLSADELKDKLQNAPSGFCDCVVYTAGEKIKNNELDSLRVINVIDTVLKTDLKMLLS